MQVTKEQIELHIKGVKSQIDDGKALVNQLTGALSVLEGILTHLNQEVPEQGSEFISDTNATIQEHDRKQQEEFMNASR